MISVAGRILEVCRWDWCELFLFVCVSFLFCLVVYVAL